MIPLYYEKEHNNCVELECRDVHTVLMAETRIILNLNWHVILKILVIS